jgi:indole-3-glycerol phosphate synthase
MTNILEKIIQEKKEALTEIKKNNSLSSLENKIKTTNIFLDFKNAINNNKKISLISEIKKASPSAGILVKDFNHIDIAKLYIDNGATCLSVLTEEKNFLGKLDYIKDIKDNFKIPVLAKDFFIDPYQIALSKSYGCDCILLIIAALEGSLANEIYDEAIKNKLSVIVEVHNQKEAEMALRFKDAIIGINNRNLKTLKTDINTTYDIHDVLLNHQGPLISESGIKTKDELLDLNNKTSIKTFLIGESLLKNLTENSIFSVL